MVEPDALIQACKNKNETLALELIDKKAVDFGYIDERKNTALIIACKNKMENVAIKLIETGQSKPEHFNNDGMTALMYACLSFVRETLMEEVAIKLIETGQSKPEHINNDGMTALMYACLSNDMEKVAIKLIETGQSKPEHINNDGMTALMFVCETVMEKVAIKLIETGQSKPEHINKSGDTALIFACRSEFMNNAAIKLIETGQSNPQQVNKEGKTALYYANNNGFDDVVYLLETKLKPKRLFETESENAEQKIKNSIDLNEMGTNIAEQETMIVGKYLGERLDNIVLKYETTYYLLKKQDLKNQLANKTALFYECYTAGNNSDNTLDRNINFTTTYFDLKKVGVLVGYVNKTNIENMLSSFSSQMYVIHDTQNTFKSVMSLSYYDGSGGQSSSHCQEGQDGRLFTINPTTVLFSSPSENNMVNLKEDNNTKQIGILVDGQKKIYPIDDGTTALNLKMLLVKNGISGKEENIRFIYLGKLINNDVLIISLPDYSNETVLQAVIKKTGGKTKRIRTKKNKNKTMNKKMNRTKNKTIKRKK